MVSLLISAGLFSGSAFAITPTPTSKPASVPSYPAWDSASTYTAGQRVTQNGTTYEAQWWTKGDNPATAGAWGAWKVVGASVTPTPTTTTTPSVTPSATPSATPSGTPSARRRGGPAATSGCPSAARGCIRHAG